MDRYDEMALRERPKTPTRVSALTPAPFRWRTSKQNGRQELLPSEMDTHHVFYTLVMIWNHTMLEEAKTHNYKKYEFGPFYTKEYMTQAIHAMARELSTRKGMTQQWKDMLAGMLKWLSTYQLMGQYLIKE